MQLLIPHQYTFQVYSACHIINCNTVPILLKLPVKSTCHDSGTEHLQGEACPLYNYYKRVGFHLSPDTLPLRLHSGLMMELLRLPRSWRHAQRPHAF